MWSIVIKSDYQVINYCNMAKTPASWASRSIHKKAPIKGLGLFSFVFMKHPHGFISLGRDSSLRWQIIRLH